MNAARELDRLSHLTQRRVSVLRRRVTDIRLKSFAERDALLASTAIDAAGLWNSFLRAYYLSIVSKARTISGARLSFSHQFTSHDAAIRFAIASFGKPVPTRPLTRRDDPAWHDIRAYFQLVQSAGASNITAVTAALAHQTLYFRYLTTVRNFYAHRCEDTFNKAARLAIAMGITSRPNVHPNMALTAILSGSACELITDWLYDIEWVVDDLCA